MKGPGGPIDRDDLYRHRHEGVSRGLLRVVVAVRDRQVDGAEVADLESGLVDVRLSLLERVNERVVRIRTGEQDESAI